MCGRFSLYAPRSDVQTRFGATFAGDYQPHYNAAPSESLHVVRDVDPSTISTAEWGLVPTWADERNGGQINARAETVAEKPSFRDAFAGVSGATDRGDGGGATAGRCLVPADGFYEWADADGGRQPYRLTVADDDLFAMVGLWTRWTPTRRQSDLGEFAGADAGDPTVETFAIVTTEANDTVAAVHDRMPVILDREAESDWLTGDPEAATTLLDPYDGPMDLYAVSHEVNDASNDVPSVVEPLEG